MDVGRGLRSSRPGGRSEWQHSKRLKSLPPTWNPQSCQYILQGVWEAKHSDASDVSVVERTSAEDGWSFAWPIHLSSFISLKCSSTNTLLSPFQNTVLTNMHHMSLFCIFTKLFSPPETVFPGHWLRQHHGHFLTSLFFILTLSAHLKVSKSPEEASRFPILPPHHDAVTAPSSRIPNNVFSLQFSCSVTSNSLWPHWLQHARLPCPSPIPRAYSKSCPSCWWCHPTISFSIVSFSSPYGLCSRCVEH